MKKTFLRNENNNSNCSSEQWTCEITSKNNQHIHLFSEDDHFQIFVQVRTPWTVVCLPEWKTVVSETRLRIYETKGNTQNSFSPTNTLNFNKKRQSRQNFRLQEHQPGSMLADWESKRSTVRSPAIRPSRVSSAFRWTTASECRFFSFASVFFYGGGRWTY